MVKGIKGISGIGNVLGRPTTNYTLQSTYENFLLGTNFFDLYYGKMLITGNAQVGSLWINSFTSETASETAALAAGAYVKEIDVDFDAVFQTERLLGGKALMNLIWTLAVGLTFEVWGYVTVNLKKVSNGTETIIGTFTTDIKYYYNNAGGDDVYTYDENYLMDVTRTNFGAEDILRLTIEVWGKAGTIDAKNYVGLTYNGTDKTIIPFVNTNEY